MLRVASADKRIDINRAEDDATPSPAKLADLFAVVPACDHYKFQRERTPDPADLLGTLLKHPDFPRPLSHRLAEIVTEDLLNVVDTESPEILRAALALYVKD